MEHFWKINNLKRDKETGVVQEVWYRVETVHEGYESTEMTSTTLTPILTSSLQFIPYDDLTESTVVDWVKTEVDYGGIESMNSESIDRMIKAKAAETTEQGIPW